MEILSFALIAIGFALLIKGADWLVDGATAIAQRLKISNLVIGLTIVAFGTSAPELVVNIIASSKGASEVVMGNILGSNIANILLILGIAAFIFPLRVQKGTIWKEIPLGLLAAILIGILAHDQLIDNAATSTLSRIDGLVLFAFFIIFLYYTHGIIKNKPELEHALTQKYGLTKSIGIVLLGLTALVLGGRWIVNGVMDIATSFGVSQSLLGLTVVAVGTSLPELATSAVAAFKKNADIAVGNVVGSNIFNVFFVLAISAIIRPVPLYPGAIVDISLTIFSSLLLFIWMFIGRKHTLERWQGILFIVLYAAYIIYLVMRA